MTTTAHKPQLKRGMLVAFSLSSDGLSELFLEHVQVSGKLRNTRFKRYLGVVLDTSVYDPLGVVKDGLHRFSRPPPEDIRLAIIGPSPSSSSPAANSSALSAKPLRIIVHQIRGPRSSRSQPPVILTREELEDLENDVNNLTPIASSSPPPLLPAMSSLGVYEDTLSNSRESERMDGIASCDVFSPLIDVWTNLEDAPGPLSDPSEFEKEVNVTKQLLADWFAVPASCPRDSSSPAGLPILPTSTTLTTRQDNPLSKDEKVVLVTLGLGAALTAGMLWSRYARR